MLPQKHTAPRPLIHRQDSNPSASEIAFQILRHKNNTKLFREYERLAVRLLHWSEPPLEVLAFWELLRSEVLKRMEPTWVDLLERFERLLSQGEGYAGSVISIDFARQQILERMQKSYH